MRTPPRPPAILDSVELRILCQGKALGDWFAAKIISIEPGGNVMCKTPDGALLVRYPDEYGFLWRYPPASPDPTPTTKAAPQ